jgi:hypothetical protein
MAGNHAAVHATLNATVDLPGCDTIDPAVGNAANAAGDDAVNPAVDNPGDAAVHHHSIRDDAVRHHAISHRTVVEPSVGSHGRDPSESDVVAQERNRADDAAEQMTDPAPATGAPR